MIETVLGPIEPATLGIVSMHEHLLTDASALQRPGVEALDALRALRDSGRKLILVTGRLLPDLTAVFGGLDLFDRVVAENGAVLYRPSSREERSLADAPPAEFVATLVTQTGGPCDSGWPHLHTPAIFGSGLVDAAGKG